MKKLIFLMFIFSLEVFGGVLQDLKTFSADFTQQIDDKENKIVTYKGKLFAKKPQTALWKYMKPIQKDVYINNHSVVIIEPDLEQVIMRNIKNDFNFFELLENAKKIGTNKYIAHYNDFEFTLIFNGKDIEKLLYKDNFENLVTITFSNQKYNEKINSSLFQPKIPKEYDVINE